MLWKDATWISFDTETSGKYPLESEICEIAAVKWKSGQIIDRFQTLIRVSKPMSDAVIAIHGITNEMLTNAPDIEFAIRKFYEFIGGGILVAHHAPFDLGFLAFEFEKYKLPLPTEPVFCTSLLSRKLFLDSTNHKLQTLIEYFNLPKGKAHRALDDAEACLQVALRCLEKVGPEVTLADVEAVQGEAIRWSRFSIDQLRTKVEYRAMIESILNSTDVQIVYRGGSRPGQARTVTPIGLVRSPNGDFLVATDGLDQMPKRFFIDKIEASRL